MNTISYNAAISACGKGQQWLGALQLLREMPEKVVVADAISYNAAISACDKCNQWYGAVQLLCEMPEKTILASTISYVDAISACLAWRVVAKHISDLYIRPDERPL